MEDAEENQTGLSNDHVQLVQKIEAEWKEKLEKSKVQFKSELEFLESSFNRQVQIFIFLRGTFNICVWSTCKRKYIYFEGAKPESEDCSS